MNREQFFAALLLLRNPGEELPRAGAQRDYVSLPRHNVHVSDHGVEVTHYTPHGAYVNKWKGALTEENLNRIVEEMV